MHRMHSMHPAALAVLAIAFALAGAIMGCGDKNPVSTNGQQGDGGPRGTIAGSAFLNGNFEQTRRIIIDFHRLPDELKVDTAFPNSEGEYSSAPLVPGSYMVVAYPDTTIKGYITVILRGILVEADRVTPLSIDIPDTSRARIVNVTPAQDSLVVPRRPVIRGEFLSQGSGINTRTFSMTVNGERVTSQADVVFADDLKSGSFMYEPAVNIPPGEIPVDVRIQQRGGNQTILQWTFTILPGVQRKVPADYPTVQLAQLAANEGDTVLVAPGVHFMSDLRIDKQIVFLSASFLAGDLDPTRTVLEAMPSTRHFRAGADITDQTLIRGFTLRGGEVRGIDEGGAIRCSDCELVVESCVFENNRAPEGRGGAIAMVNRGSMRIVDCSFRDNSARTGGAIAIFGGSAPEIERCYFVDNQALLTATEGGLGGAIYLLAATLDVHNCTFFHNSANMLGGAIMSDAAAPSSSEIKSELNLYILNSTRPGTGGAIHLFNSSTLRSSCDGFLVDIDPWVVRGTVYADHRTLLDWPDDDPGFCNLENEDLRLVPSSRFLEQGCEPGAFPIGCGGFLGLW